MIDGLFQPIHLVLILAIIMIVFGAGKLPEMGGAIGRGIREFRNEVHDASESDGETQQTSVSGTLSAQSQTGSFCTNCGEHLASSAKFCPSCGTAVNVETAPSTVMATEVEAEPVPQESAVS